MSNIKKTKHENAAIADKIIIPYGYGILGLKPQ